MNNLPAEVVREQRVCVKQCAELWGCSVAQYWRLVSGGVAPDPVVRGGRFTRWRLGDVLDALRAQAGSGAKVAQAGGGAKVAQAGGGV